MKYFLLLIIATNLVFTSCKNEVISTQGVKSTQIEKNEPKNEVYDVKYIGDAKRYKIGEFPTNFIMNPNTDKSFGLHSLRGKVVMIDFSASWCHNCHAAEPILHEAANNFTKEEFAFITVRVDYNPDEFKKKAEENPKFINIKDSPRGKYGLNSHYKVPHFPYIMLLDKEGKLVKFVNANNSGLIQSIKDLVKE